jgi:hypothetical protein
VGCALPCFSIAHAGDIHGTALEKGGSTRVPGVTVQLFLNGKNVAETNTGTDGTYMVPINSDGDYKITFSMEPDRCEAPYVAEPGLKADTVKVENVFVYPANQKLDAKALAAMIKQRITGSNDPAQAFADLVALSTSGVEPEVLVVVGKEFAKEQPNAVSPTTGRIVVLADQALQLFTEHGGDAKTRKTSFETIFIDESGKKIPREMAETSFIGKQSTVFSQKEGTDWVVKSVILSDMGG